MDITKPRDSATVILVRQSEKTDWEVLLARRHQRQSFMAGAYVFPGGQVDEADGDFLDCIRMPASFNPAALLRDSTLTPEQAFRLYICAFRETFEETGILLAVNADGRYPENSRIGFCREEIRKCVSTFHDIIRREHFFLPFDRLLPYAYWITPEVAPKRFSTWFFLASLPEGQNASTDAVEMTDYVWITPREALRRNAGKEIQLMPPTLKTLEELSAYATLDALWNATRKKVIYPVLPQPEGNMLKLPHDPEYSLEKYKQPSRPGDPSRIILIDDIWQTGFAPDK